MFLLDTGNPIADLIGGIVLNGIIVYLIINVVENFHEMKRQRRR